MSTTFRELLARVRLGTTTLEDEALLRRLYGEHWRTVLIDPELEQWVTKRAKEEENRDVLAIATGSVALSAEGHPA